jgi:hypothetical protein
MRGLDWAMLFMLVTGLIVLIAVITVAVVVLPLWLKPLPVLGVLGGVVLLCAD